MRLKNLPLILVVIVAATLFFRPEFRALLPAWPGYGVKQFIRLNSPLVALTHLRMIDGTGAPPLRDAVVILANSKIQAIGSDQTTTIPPGTQILDLSGRTVIPGLGGDARPHVLRIG